MHRKTRAILAIIAVILLCAVILLLCLLPRNRSENEKPASTGSGTTTALSSTASATTAPVIPSASVPLETTVPPTTATPETTVPPTTVQAPTEPTVDPIVYIGTLYTRTYLESLDTTLKGYGAGPEVDSRNRPTYAIQLTEKFQHFDAHFIAPDDGNIYLSFNCGYEYENLTAVVLDALKERDVKAVFFVNYGYASKNPGLIRRIIDEGHILANHCTGHPDLPRLLLDDIVTEIMTIHNYVLDTYGYEMKLFRPPSGYYSEQVLAVAQSLGYRTYNFSFTYRDWETDNQPDPGETLNKLITGAHSGAIYQLHTVSSTNAAIIGSFIDAMRDEGYTFATLP